MALDPVKNFAKVTVSIGYDASETSIALTAGHGARLPAPSTDGSFNLVWWNVTDYSAPTDDPNVEIVRCTARSTDTLTVTRAQESTSASTKNTSSKTYKMILAPTAKMITDITSGTQTLTNKTLTTPTITKPVMDATNPSAQTYSPAGGATATLDLSLANEHRITMPAGNITIALSNDTNGQKFIVSITQDGTGSRTVTWFSTIKWAGGSVPTLTTTASKRDTFGFIRTGSGTYDGFIIGQNI